MYEVLSIDLIDKSSLSNILALKKKIEMDLREIVSRLIYNVDDPLYLFTSFIFQLTDIVHSVYSIRLWNRSLNNFLNAKYYTNIIFLKRINLQINEVFNINYLYYLDKI